MVILLNAERINTDKDVRDTATLLQQHMNAKCIVRKDIAVT